MWAALIIMAVSAIVSATMAAKQGEAQQEASEFNAKVAEQNAKASQDKADYDEQMQRQKARLLMGSQIAAYSASGGDVSEGTPLDVIARQALDSEREAIAIKYSGAVAKSQALSEATGQRISGQNYKAAGQAQAVGSILKGASSMAGAATKSGI
jgi:hypothetical protein